MAKDLVTKIYDSLLDPGLVQPALDEFCAAVGAAGCIIFDWGGADGAQLRARHFSSIYGGGEIAQYLSFFQQEEERDQLVFERHSMAHDAIDLIDDDVLAGSDAELLARPNVQALANFGVPYRSAGLLDKDNRARSRFSIQFGEGNRRMTPAQRAFAKDHLPHFAKALSLGYTVEALHVSQGIALDLVEDLRSGVCVIDARRRIVLENAEFARQREAYGTFGRDGEGRLAFRSDELEGQLAKLLGFPEAHGKFGARPRKEAIAAGKAWLVGPLCIEISPLNNNADLGTGFGAGAVILSVDSSAPFTCNFALVARAFGLTGAEAALLPMLADGLTNGQIAEARDRRVPTINAQVKSILGKAKCANRTQLVRAMMNFQTGYG